MRNYSVLLYSSLLHWQAPGRIIMSSQLLKLTAKASWYSKTLMSDMVRPACSRTLGVAYVGLEINTNQACSTLIKVWVKMMVNKWIYSKTMTHKRDPIYFKTLFPFKVVSTFLFWLAPISWIPSDFEIIYFGRSLAENMQHPLILTWVTCILCS